MIAMDGEFYTWGRSNLHGCLGHVIRDQFVEHTADPGHASGFGAIVERVGRGMVRDYALGREFTIKCDIRTKDPSEDVARKLMEEEAIRCRYVGIGGRAGRRHPTRLERGRRTIYAMRRARTT